jgi:hypothetical protein
MSKFTKAKSSSRVTRSANTQRPLPRGLTERVVWRAVHDLKPFPGNPRRHPESQIAGLMKSIRKVWTNPILIDETGTILAGHGRLEAAKRLGMSEVPTVSITGLNPGEKRAILIADNRLPERAVWDFDVLRKHLQDLIEIDFDVELTGFSTGEVDLVLDGQPGTRDPADDLSGLPLDGPAVSKLGDRWKLGRHLLMCGDALRGDDYQRLLGVQAAQMVSPTRPSTSKFTATPWDGARYDIGSSRSGRARCRNRNLLPSLRSSFAWWFGIAGTAQFTSYSWTGDISRNC